MKSKVASRILDNTTEETKEKVKEFAKEIVSKTKKCNWCNKRKPLEQIYYIGDLFLCDKCNLKYDLI